MTRTRRVPGGNSQDPTTAAPETTTASLPRSRQRGPQTTAHTDRPELPERQRALLAVLRDHSSTDPAGRLVSSWTQAQLATALHTSIRTLRRVLDDLREPDTDPRHSRTDRPPGRRLGLVKIEPVLREAPRGGRLYAENLYVLDQSWPVGPASKPRQTPKPRRKAAARTASIPDPAEDTDRPLTLWPMLDPEPEDATSDPSRWTR